MEAAREETVVFDAELSQHVRALQEGLPSAGLNTERKEEVLSQSASSDWQCAACSTANLVAHSTCSLCTSPAPSSPNHWECVGCEACIPLDAPVCPKCGDLPPWQCGPCHSHNKEGTRACVNCNSPRGTLEVGIAHSNPILRGYEPLSTLAGDSGSGVIKAKVMSLLDSHPFWCKVRGDGNCFYRAAALGLLVFGLSPQSPTGFFRTLIGRLRDTQALPEVAPVSLAMDITAAFLESLSSGWVSDGTASTTRLISEIAGDPKLDAAIVTCMRALTASQIRRDFQGNMEVMLATIFPWLSLEEYITAEVSQYGECASDLALKALPEALGIQLRIIYGDNKSGDFEVDYPADKGGFPQVHLFMVPGHYDCLFPADRSSWGAESSGEEESLELILSCTCGACTELTERSDRCTIGRANALGSPIIPSPLDAVTTDESGANADSATDTDTELAVVDVTRSGSPQVPSAVACTSPNVETNVEEDARSDTANLVTGSSTEALVPDPPSLHETTAGTAVLEAEEVSSLDIPNEASDGNEVGVDDSAGMDGNNEGEEATTALHTRALIVVPTNVSGGDSHSATDNDRQLVESDVMGNGSARVSSAVVSTSPTAETKAEDDARLNSFNLNTGVTGALDPDLLSEHGTMAVAGGQESVEVVRASPKETTEETKVGRKGAVYLDDNTEGTVSEDEAKEVAPDGAHDSKTASPAVTLTESSVGDQDAPGTSAGAEGDGQVVAGVFLAFTPVCEVKPPCTCCNTFTSPGDRCRARRVLTRTKSRVVPCRLKLGDTPGPARQCVGTPATDPAPTQGTPLPSPRLLLVADKTTVIAGPTLLTSTSPGKIAQGEVPL